MGCRECGGLFLLAEGDIVEATVHSAWSESSATRHAVGSARDCRSAGPPAARASARKAPEGIQHVRDSVPRGGHVPYAQQKPIRQALGSHDRVLDTRPHSSLGRSRRATLACVEAPEAMSSTTFAAVTIRYRVLERGEISSWAAGSSLIVSSA
jgi:hypothetical protein